MSAIEKITSKTKEIHIAGSDPNAPADVIEVPVWNDTVANLTLMALGNYDHFLVIWHFQTIAKKDLLGPRGIVDIISIVTKRELHSTCWFDVLKDFSPIIDSICPP